MTLTVVEQLESLALAHLQAHGAALEHIRVSPETWQQLCREAPDIFHAHDRSGYVNGVLVEVAQ